MCCFVLISSKELEDHLQCMKNGEELTPKVEPPIPIEPPCNSLPNVVQLSAETDSTLSLPSTAESTPMHSPTSCPPTSTGSCGVDVDDFSHDNSFAGEIEPDVDTSPSAVPTSSAFNEPTHVSTFTDDMLDPALHTHSKSNRIV
jgi:hypothetical protein